MSAQTAGRSTAQPVDVSARVGEPCDDTVLHLAARVVLRGVVIADGQPAPGVRLWASKQHSPLDFDAFTERAIDAVTRSDGTFTIDGVAAGPVKLRVADYDLLEPASIVA